MNKKQKEVQQAFLDAEKEVLEQLKKNYQDALDEINTKIAILMGRDDAYMSHVMYQVVYQEALKKQVESVLNTLQANEFETISDYLAKSYEDGYIGTMYDIQGQGIPIIMPMNQEQIVQAIQHETKLSEGLYKALGKDVKVLSKQIAGEITRGISSGQMYSEIARNIASYAGISRNKAMRIARTEGHRIQCKATMDAQFKAKEKGADVVKQWDSYLDRKTRSTHRKLDGQIRELDEEFEVNGHFAMMPGGFNRASEDINCRCALLQRARWALDESELETLKKRAEYFELDKAEDFADYKKKYLKAVESDRVRVSPQKKNNTEGTNDIQNSNEIATNAIKEAYEYNRVQEGYNLVPFDELDEKVSIKASFKGMDERLAEDSAKQFSKLSKEYKTVCQSIKVENLEVASAPAGTLYSHNTRSAEITFNKAVVKNYDGFSERMDKAIERGQFFKMDAEQYGKYITTHEFAHTLMDFESPLKNFVGADTTHIKNARKEIKKIHEAYLIDIRETELKYRQAEQKALETFDPIDWDIAQKAKEEIDAKNISKYADMGLDEFMAEGFADALVGSEPSEYSLKIKSVIDKYFKK